MPDHPVGIGTSALASLPAGYGYEVGRERATAPVRRVLHIGLNVPDRSAGYGDGESERRIGAAARRRPVAVLGVTSSAPVDETVALATTAVPDELWSTLDRHAPQQ